MTGRWIELRWLILGGHPLDIFRIGRSSVRCGTLYFDEFGVCCPSVWNSSVSEFFQSFGKLEEFLGINFRFAVSSEIFRPRADESSSSMRSVGDSDVDVFFNPMISRELAIRVRALQRKGREQLERRKWTITVFGHFNLLQLQDLC